MFPRCLVLPILAMAMALTAGQASAQRRDPGSDIRVDTGAFGLLLDANYLSPRGCDRVVGFTYGAPTGARAYRDTDAFSIIVETGDQSCGRPGPRLVREMRSINVGPLPRDVLLYFVSTRGQVLKQERIAVHP